MKRIKVMACMALLLGGLYNVSAADRAGEILGRVADGFRTMKRYTVRFEIVADDYRTAGGYAVSDGNYRLYLGDDAEVFSDGKVRYEVDHRRGEVTISEVNRWTIPSGPSTSSTANMPLRWSGSATERPASG